ncbi:hypothetical protein HRbin06_00570 [archaeon HR06]|nr:hypothetical protein HRbin06_00570 [archaeon HR06]
MKWIKKNISDYELLSKIDFRSEYDPKLTFNENITLLKEKYPGIWKGEEERIKRIVFLDFIIQKILNFEVKVTYRKTPKYGLYYVVNNRFKGKPVCLIEFYHTEAVDPYKLTDDDAKLAGIDTAEEIIKLFKKWYKEPLPTMWRNWFRLKNK